MYLRVRHAAPQVRDWDENAARMPGGHRRVNGSNLTVGLKFFNTIELVDTGVWFDTFFKFLHEPIINIVGMVK